MNGEKSAITSIGVMGPALSILVLLVNQFVFKGEVVTAGDTTSLVDAIATIVGLVTGIIGRLKASKTITKIV